ncbi:MAG: TolC family protein [Bdellovibrio sp.]|nr:TolC family protein [Bdellovibrio sp.]
MRLVLILILATASVSQGATTLEWSSLLRKVYDQNSDLQSLVRSRDAAQYQRSAVKSDYMPSLFAFGDRTREEQETSLLNKDLTTDTYGLKASWNLFNGFSTYNTVRKYNFEERQAESQIRTKMADLRYDLRRAYFQMLISQRAQRTWSKLLRLQTDQLSVVQIKYNNGGEALWSVELSKANVEVTKATIELEVNNFNTAKKDVEVLLGEPLPEEIILNDDIDSQLKMNVKGEVTDAHPDLMFLQDQVNEAWADSAIQKAGFSPNLRANLQWAKAKPEDQETVNDNRFSLTLTLPLFEGFSTINQTSRTRAVALSREFTLRDSRLRLLKNVEQARSLFVANLTYLRAKELEVKATNMWSGTIEKQYRLGVRKYSDWDQAQTKMITSERDYLKSLRDTLDSRITLEKALAVTEAL